MPRLALVVLLVGLAGCGGPVPVGAVDGGPMPLVCATPRTEPLVVATMGALAGAPMVTIGWAVGRCELGHDERASSFVLMIADLAGTGFGELTAFPGNDWSVTATMPDLGSTSSYVPNLPRDTDLTFEMSNRTGDDLAITFRVTGSVLTLVSMRRR